MFTSATPVSVAELAQLLIARKKRGKSTLLFLGARASGLFSNQAFYNDLQHFSKRKDWNMLSSVDKFKECHHVLKDVFEKEYLNDPDTKKIIEDFINEWLKEAAEREVNSYVAGLVKAGFFDIIISVNMDSLLEDTLGTLGMRRSHDYSVVNVLDPSIDMHMIGETSCTIVKVFGEFVPGNYKTMMGEISLSGSKRLRMLLNSLQNRDILSMGYDPLWDKQIEAVSSLGGELWYINETLPEYNSEIVKALERNQGKYLVGIYYERFFRELYTFVRDDEVLVGQAGQSLSESNSNALNDQIPQIMGNQSNNPLRRKVFISYSHKDKPYLERLLVHLGSQIENETDLLDIWCDTRFEGGEDWHKEIQEAIATTQIAIFLVSADFLASRYVKEHELPPLMEAASAKEAILLSIIVSPCSFLGSGLDRYNAMNSASLTLLEMELGVQERVWQNTARHVKKLLFPEQ